MHTHGRLGASLSLAPKRDARARASHAAVQCRTFLRNPTVVGCGRNDITACPLNVVDGRPYVFVHIRTYTRADVMTLPAAGCVDRQKSRRRQDCQELNMKLYGWCAPANQHNTQKIHTHNTTHMFTTQSVRLGCRRHTKSSTTILRTTQAASFVCLPRVSDKLLVALVYALYSGVFCLVVRPDR